MEIIARNRSSLFLSDGEVIICTSLVIDLVHKEYSSFSLWHGKPSSRYFKYCILTLHGPNNTSIIHTDNQLRSVEMTRNFKVHVISIDINGNYPSSPEVIIVLIKI